MSSAGFSACRHDGHPAAQLLRASPHHGGSPFDRQVFLRIYFAVFDRGSGAVQEAGEGGSPAPFLFPESLGFDPDVSQDILARCSDQTNDQDAKPKAWLNVRR